MNASNDCASVMVGLRPSVAHSTPGTRLKAKLLHKLLTCRLACDIRGFSRPPPETTPTHASAAPPRQGLDQFEVRIKFALADKLFMFNSITRQTTGLFQIIQPWKSARAIHAPLFLIAALAVKHL